MEISFARFGKAVEAVHVEPQAFELPAFCSSNVKSAP